MPSISQHHSAETTKLLVLGDSSSGKTGALASLAAAGYNLRILDLDNGLDVLRSFLTDPASPYLKGAEAGAIASRIEYETVTDSMKVLGGKLIPVKASAWQRTIDLLQNWKTDSAAFGNISTWTSQDILVIDTLSILADQALKFCLQLNARLGQKPHQSDWGDAQTLVQGLLEMLYDDSVRCNVVVNCHIKYIEDPITGAMKCFPESVGKALSPKIAKYFNNVVRTQTVGNQRKIITTSSNQLELKTSAPLKVKPEYPISTGLADLFRDLRGAASSAK